MDAAAPGSVVVEVAVENEPGALSGDCEEVRIQGDEAGVCAELKGGSGGTGTARVVNEKLAGETADERGLGTDCSSNQQEETEGAEDSERPN